MTTIKLPAPLLRDLLVGAATALPTVATGVPALEQVRVSWTATTLSVTSTDRYRLVRGTVPRDVDVDLTDELEAGYFLVSTKTVKELIRFLPKKGIDVATVTVEGLAGSVWVAGQTCSWVAWDGDYPKVDSLIPEPRDAVATDVVRFNPQYLVALAKLPSQALAPAVFHLYGDRKPALALLPGTTDHMRWEFLLMPVRGGA